ncbi:DUF5926 family protein [Flexivirga meconopsidis]|uniref:DUF5926 family protein n=1 Tax=Flexivirga meconopsidis TaxID=2977121 RepID=UPI00223EAB2E|nr:DUF5926 family protein [Flexivirga meconopsidis]
MGKASRRKGADKKAARAARVPFVARPFADLTGETELVAMREILPAATVPVRFRGPDGEQSATIATVLPMAWAALHRDDGALFVATQVGGGSGDLSRDLAAALLAAAAAEPGDSIANTPPVTADTPRLQDILVDGPFEPELHDGFDFWIAADEMDEATSAALQQANEAVAPTVALPSADTAYWCRIGERTYVRWVLPHDEDAATSALARLHAAGDSALGDGRLLGAFRTSGLLVPVWEVDATAEPLSYDAPLAELRTRFEAALASVADRPLDDAERRARAGLVSRQITIR